MKADRRRRYHSTINTDVESAKSPDLLDAAALEGDPHHEWLAELRSSDPVHWHDGHLGPPFWLITRHDDCTTVARDPETFSSALKGNNLLMPEGELLDQLRSFITRDPPSQRSIRKLVAGAFTPRAVARLEDYIRSTVRSLLDAVPDDGTTDLVRDVVAPLPRTVIGEVLGIPLADRDAVGSWSELLNAFEDPAYASAIATEQPWERLAEYALELARTRADATSDDLIPVLRRAEIDGARLTDEEFSSTFILFSVGGNETTRDTITSTVLELIRRPDLITSLRQHPGSLPSTAVEEMLRWATPLRYFSRTATRDVDLRGRTISAGDRVATYYTAANTDPEVFDDPFRFDPAREPNPHVSFGAGGPHLCIGASLARLEIRVFFEELLPRLEDVELAGDPRWLRSHIQHGMTAMPVHLRLRG